MVNEILRRHKILYKSGVTKSLNYRINQLETLRAVIQKYENEVMEALFKDLKKSEFEAYAHEVGYVLESITYALKHLEDWTTERSVKTPLHLPFSKAVVKNEPYGTVLIIAPFNYPFQLMIEPLIGAIAAGNTVVLKPSNQTPYTEAIIKKMMIEVFDENYITVVTGGREVVTELIHSPFDYIFFTGSESTGKVVMRAAAEHLVPVTLELGGKSPAVVHEDAVIETAAKRIAWGKYLNAGQSCVAPDYVYVHESKADEFMDAVIKYIIEFYGVLPQNSPDYGRIINQATVKRLAGLIDHGKVIVGGQYDIEGCYMAPTVMKDVNWNDAIMSQEIFGPILPILTYTHLEEIIDIISSKSKPLALYVFSESVVVQEHLLESLSYGGAAINDTVSQVGSPYMPFGGVGASGMGSYHGEFSYKTFSHEKSILKKSSKYDVKMIYPPYKNRLHWVKKILK